MINGILIMGRHCKTEEEKRNTYARTLAKVARCKKELWDYIEALRKDYPDMIAQEVCTKYQKLCNKSMTMAELRKIKNSVDIWELDRVVKKFRGSEEPL